MSSIIRCTMCGGDTVIDNRLKDANATFFIRCNYCGKLMNQCTCGPELYSILARDFD